MNNPYEPPRAAIPASRANVADAKPIAVVLAATGAGLVSVYWGCLLALILYGGGTLPTVIVPVILIALYAMRAVNVLSGNVQAAKALLYLHGVGALMAVLQIVRGNAFVGVLYSIKLAMHLFGAITAHFARKALIARGYESLPPPAFR